MESNKIYKLEISIVHTVNRSWSSNRVRKETSTHLLKVSTNLNLLNNLKNNIEDKINLIFKNRSKINSDVINEIRLPEKNGRSNFNNSIIMKNLKSMISYSIKLTEVDNTDRIPLMVIDQLYDKLSNYEKD